MCLLTLAVMAAARSRGKRSDRDDPATSRRSKEEDVGQAAPFQESSPSVLTSETI